ncbi:MAG: TIGR04552 family protein [Myxococcales bacterium]
MPESVLDSGFRTLDALTLADLEAVRLALRGGSVIDWYRLNFESRREIDEFIAVQEMQLEEPADVARVEAVKNAAVSYLRRNFDFPVPKPVSQADLPKLLELASSRGHRQLCACTILKVMHIIHHLDARELLFMLPVSDQEVFHLVEEKVYRVIGGMLAKGFPILEFIGGRKNKDSLYTKLLSKRETIAAQIYDKLRFRIVTRTPDDIWPTLNYLMQKVFPFNYVIPGQSTNSMFDFKSYCEAHPNLTQLLPRLQLSVDLERTSDGVDNRFTSNSYRVVHLVVDMPIRLAREMLEQVPPAGWSLGPVIFVQAEFQIVDRETEQSNELGEASHASYKQRQRQAVMRRLKLGSEEARNNPELRDESKDSEPKDSEPKDGEPHD